MKKYIPNILTSFRTIVSFFIPILLFNDMFFVLLTFYILALLSDLFDGFLARRWNVTSNTGKILDMIGDKLIAIFSLATFIFVINPNLIYLLDHNRLNLKIHQ